MVTQLWLLFYNFRYKRASRARRRLAALHSHIITELLFCVVVRSMAKSSLCRAYVFACRSHRFIASSSALIFVGKFSHILWTTEEHPNCKTTNKSAIDTFTNIMVLCMVHVSMLYVDIYFVFVCVFPPLAPMTILTHRCLANFLSHTSLTKTIIIYGSSHLCWLASYQEFRTAHIYSIPFRLLDSGHTKQ